MNHRSIPSFLGLCTALLPFSSVSAQADSAQPGIVQNIGPGCPGALGEPVLESGSTPTPGSRFTLIIGNMSQKVSSAFLLLGVSRETSGLGQLPLDLAPLGMPSCMLQVSPDGILPRPVDGGSTSYTAFIPTSDQLVGFTIYAQALVFDAGANNPLNAATSNALQITVGY